MSIRVKIILVVLPLIVATGAVVGLSASLLARSGITRIAVEALGFKARELRQYADNQWRLLVENNLADDPEYRALSEQAISSYARTLLQGATEKILATGPDGEIVFQTGDAVDAAEDEGTAFAEEYARSSSGWTRFTLGGETRVGQAFIFEPFRWRLLVSDTEDAFYGAVQDITRQTAIILGIALVGATVLLLLFSKVITLPIKRLVHTMRSITEDNDLSRRVSIEYRDEIGTLGKTFNVMIDELEHAYSQIKSYAYQAVLAKKSESKIRNIFQKYVPSDVIDQFYANPESMLVGQNRSLAILFTDIRSFTTISESFAPDELVTALNHYFEIMVDVIMENGGIVDKYIGDAIMAFFGAPVEHPDDARRAVGVALEMRRRVGEFNRAQEARELPAFRTGIGVNFGPVVVGNIGSERKMDYTVIGDMVNLASRLEGLTKKYRQELLFSRSVYDQARHVYPCRFIDKVQVKGKSSGEDIYTAEENLSSEQKELWSLYDRGIRAYYLRDFQKARSFFEQTLVNAPGDRPAEIFLERSRRYAASPPPPGWDGTEVMTEK
ncbi:MAG: adenylate/guanylate cyclase domain-containing protein [Spirochaetota bacterium]